MEGGRIFHGMPPGVKLPEEQAQIPLIVKSSVPVSVVRRPEYGQQDVFDTVVDLFSIRMPLFDTQGSFIKMRPASQSPAACAERDGVRAIYRQCAANSGDCRKLPSTRRQAGHSCPPVVRNTCEAGNASASSESARLRRSDVP